MLLFVICLSYSLSVFFLAARASQLALVRITAQCAYHARHTTAISFGPGSARTRAKKNIYKSICRIKYWRQMSDMDIKNRLICDCWCSFILLIHWGIKCLRDTANDCVCVMFVECWLFTDRTMIKTNRHVNNINASHEWGHVRCQMRWDEPESARTHTHRTHHRRASARASQKFEMKMNENYNIYYYM